MSKAHSASNRYWQNAQPSILSFGINTAAEKFQNVIASAISDIPNVKN